MDTPTIVFLSILGVVIAMFIFLYIPIEAVEDLLGPAVYKADKILSKDK